MYNIYYSYADVICKFNSIVCMYIHFIMHLYSLCVLLLTQCVLSIFYYSLISSYFHTQYFYSNHPISSIYTNNYTNIHECNVFLLPMQPNNILLGADGHVRIVDMGSVIDTDGKTLGAYSETENLAPVCLCIDTFHVVCMYTYAIFIHSVCTCIYIIYICKICIVCLYVCSSYWHI